MPNERLIKTAAEKRFEQNKFWKPMTVTLISAHKSPLFLAKAWTGKFRCFFFLSYKPFDVARYCDRQIIFGEM